MKKYLSFLTVFMIAFLMFVMPANAASREFTIQVYKANSTAELYNSAAATRLTTGVVYAVYRYVATTAPMTRETLYSDNQSTALVSNPWVIASRFAAYKGGTIHFWTDPTATDDKTVQILVIDAATGFSEWVNAVYDKTHTVIIDERKGIQTMLTIPSSSTVPSTAGDGAFYQTVDATSTYLGIDFAPGTIIQDVFLDITAAGASNGTGGSSLDLGHSTTGTAYISLLATFTAGFAQDDVFDEAMQYITRDPAYAKIYMTWRTDSFDGFINFLKIMR